MSSCHNQLRDVNATPANIILHMTPDADILSKTTVRLRHTCQNLCADSPYSVVETDVYATENDVTVAELQQ